MASHQPAPFTANSAAFQDVPDTLIDQAVEAGIPGRNAWQSINWQFTEVGLLGSVRVQVLASLDGLNWVDLVGGVASPTEGEINPADVGPGDLLHFILTTTSDPDNLSYRYYKVQALSPAGDPTRYGRLQVYIYTR